VQSKPAARPPPNPSAAGTVKPKNSKEDIEAHRQRSVGKGMNLYSLERRKLASASSSPRKSSAPPAHDDPSSPNTSIASARTSSATPTPRVPFTIKVIDSDEVNAFALPDAFSTSIAA